MLYQLGGSILLIAIFLCCVIAMVAGIELLLGVAIVLTAAFGILRRRAMRART